MKIFERDGKINFVDENNVFVGYDTERECCEQIWWSLSLTPNELPNYDGANGINHDGFNFETDFFHAHIMCGNSPLNDDTMFAVFKLSKNNEHVYLQLVNHHNGYYQHGFEMSRNEEIIHSGKI